MSSQAHGPIARKAGGPSDSRLERPRHATSVSTRALVADGVAMPREAREALGELDKSCPAGLLGRTEEWEFEAQLVGPCGHY